MELFDRFDRRALNIRATLSESMCFGVLKHDLFDQCMEDINDLCISENSLWEFIKQKGLKTEFEQYCNLGTFE
jgi:hypothetical protein